MKLELFGLMMLFIRTYYQWQMTYNFVLSYWSFSKVHQTKWRKKSFLELILYYVFTAYYYLMKNIQVVCISLWDVKWKIFQDLRKTL